MSDDNQAAEVTMAERVERFWRYLETEHVRIGLDLRRGEPGREHWDFSCFNDDVAKALVKERSDHAPCTLEPVSSRKLVEWIKGNVPLYFNYGGKAVSYSWSPETLTEDLLAFLTRLPRSAATTDVPALELDSTSPTGYRVRDVKIEVKHLPSPEPDAVREALEAFAEIAEHVDCTTSHVYTDDDTWEVPLGLLRAAKSALSRPAHGGWPDKLPPEILVACCGGGITTDHIQHVYGLIRAAMSLSRNDRGSPAQ